MTLGEFNIDHLEVTVSSKMVFEGRVVNLRVDEARLPHGGIRRREVIEHPGGVVVIPILPNGNVLLVRQFRYALGAPLFELPAGKLEKGELPADAIKRELEEETGYCTDQWEHLTTVYTSPGFCNEALHLFAARNIQLSVNPRREEDEFIEVIEVSVDKLKRMVQERQMIDAKSLCILGYLSLAGQL